MKTCLLLVLIFATLSEVQAQSVKNICNLKNGNLTTVKSLDQLDTRICEIEGSGTSEVVASSRNVLAVINRLKESQDNNLNNDELNSSLQSLAEILGQAKAPAKYSPIKNDQKSKAMEELFANYGTEEARFKDPEGYSKQIMEVLALSKDGKKVIDCFNKKDNANVIGSTIEFTPQAESAGTRKAGGAEYQVRENAEGKFVKTITLDPGPEAFFTINILAHEMQHSCNTLEMIDFQKKISDYQNRRVQTIMSFGLPDPRLPRTGPLYLTLSQKTQLESALATLDAEADTLSSQQNIRYAIDEMKAYRMSVKNFKEFAVYDPELFCSKVFVGSFFGKQVLSSGEYISTMEAQFNDKNRFFHTFIEAYTRLNGYRPENFYEVDPTTLVVKRDSNNLPIIKPEVKSLLAKEGFDVQ